MYLLLKFFTVLHLSISLTSNLQLRCSLPFLRRKLKSDNIFDIIGFSKVGNHLLMKLNELLNSTINN